MADEFIKGLAVATTAGLGWMVLAGWYNTPSFGGDQLIGPSPENPDLYAELGLVLKEALFWFAIFAMLTFWVLIPALNRIRGDTAEGA